MTGKNTQEKEVFNRKRGYTMHEMTKCKKCENYQPYEPDAGLTEGCTADALYADEGGQEIIPEVDKEITQYMGELGEGCPYFIESQYIKRKIAEERKA